MTRLILATSAALLTLSLSAPGYAETWRWVDAEGVVNYSERKPKGVDAELVAGTESARRRNDNRTTTATPAPPPSIPGATRAQPPLNERQQQMLAELESAEANRQAQVAKVRQENCLTARRVLENLTVRDRVRVRMEDGSTRVLGEDERQARIEEAQQGIVVNCES